MAANARVWSGNCYATSLMWEKIKERSGGESLI